MITAKEALNAVRNGKELNINIREIGILGDMCAAIINNINKGWLCVSMVPFANNIREFHKAKEFLKELDYSFDKHDVCYWMSEQRWVSDDSR